MKVDFGFVGVLPAEAHLDDQRRARAQVEAEEGDAVR